MLRSAPSFASSSVRPGGNAAVAKNSATVKPMPAVAPATSTSRQVIFDGRWKPSATAIATATPIPRGFPARIAPSTAHVAVPDGADRHASIGKAEREQNQLNRVLPPVLELVDVNRAARGWLDERPRVPTGVRN